MAGSHTPRVALVTGAAGFIGSSVTRRLASSGWNVIGIEAFTDYYDPARKRRNAAWAAEGGDVTIIERDLLDPQLDLTELVSSSDVVFHLAAQPGVRASWGEHFGEYSRRNVDATQRLLEAAVDVPRLRRFVYASSSSVYGDAEQYPTGEDDTPAPISPYGVTKLAAEHLTRLYGRLHGVPTVALRYFTVYGPRQRPDMAFHRFIRAALTDQPISLYGDGSQIREFTYVDDVVEANIRAAEATDIEAGRVYNVSGGTSISVNDALDAIAELSGRTLSIDRRPTARGDVYRTGGSVNRIRAELAWAPLVGIRDGLRAEIDWLRAELRLEEP